MKKKINPDGRTYRKRELELVDIYLNVVDCQKCGSPTNSGYCCPFCKDDNPTMPPEKKENDQN